MDGGSTTFLSVEANPLFCFSGDLCEACKEDILLFEKTGEWEERPGLFFDGARRRREGKRGRQIVEKLKVPSCSHGCKGKGHRHLRG